MYALNYTIPIYIYIYVEREREIKYYVIHVHVHDIMDIYIYIYICPGRQGKEVKLSGAKETRPPDSRAVMASRCARFTQ